MGDNSPLKTRMEYLIHVIVSLLCGDRLELEASWHLRGPFQKLFCAFIDYKKAFDSVQRGLLWGKLLNSGVNGKVLL